MIALAVAGLLAVLLGAGPPQADVNRAAEEDFTHWSHFHEAPRPPAGAAYGDFVLPPSVFGMALPNLEDLRLTDEGTGKVIPYASASAGRPPRNARCPAGSSTGGPGGTTRPS